MGGFINTGNVGRLYIGLVAGLVLSTAAKGGIQDGLVHWYTFNESAGSIAFDQGSGNVPGVVNGVVNRVIGPDGSGAIEITDVPSSFVSIDGGVGQFGVQDFSVAFWINTQERERLTDLVGNRSEVDCGTYFQARLTGIHEFLPNGRIYAEIYQNECQYGLVAENNAELNDGNWHHIIFARQGAYLTMFTDGLFIGEWQSDDVANIQNGRLFKIGRSLTWSEPDFTPQASFDDLRIYDRALNASDAWELFLPQQTVDASEQPADFRLDTPYPNPFNPLTTIPFHLTETGPVTLNVLDLAGRTVATLVDGLQERGAHEVSFDGSQLPSGLYVARLKTENGEAAQKLLLAK
jgi:hypothetical protein